MSEWISHLWELVGWLIGYLWDWIKATITWNPIKRGIAWYLIDTTMRAIGQHVWGAIDGLVESTKTWLETLIDDIAEILVSVWGSITSVWATFGADLLTARHTVVTWVARAVLNVRAWARARYDEVRAWAWDAWVWVRDKSRDVWRWIIGKGTAVWEWVYGKGSGVWEWIQAKANQAWDWITGPGDQIEAWRIANGAYYEELRETQGNKLLAFLQNPGEFIGELILDSLEWLLSEIVFRHFTVETPKPKE